MIVSMNPDNEGKYLALFVEACEFLNSKGYNIEKERFESLAEYYSYMAEFFKTEKYKYIMMPLDEEPFNINLNTRTITVPQSFSKCASVQSDQLAETIIFVVDRYFDYMDLANTQIFVQWTIPENKKTGFPGYNGATHIEMIDRESEPGKLKFAWPLNDKITKVPGAVKFSVRFFRTEGPNGEKLLYSLNTTEAEIIIKEALQPNLDINYNVEAPIDDLMFEKAILNSLYADEGVVPPVDPSFISPGSNIDAPTMREIDGKKIASLENDTITLSAQAIVVDAGTLTYKWYYKADDKDTFYDCENYPVFDEEGKIIEGSTVKFGEVKDNFVEVSPAAREMHERYYVQDGNGYKLYIGEIPPKDETVKLFERYSTLTVPADGIITGAYQAEAYNSISVPNSDKVLTNINPRTTKECLVPPPADIVFTENGYLADGKILLPVLEGEEKVLKTELAVEVVEDKYEPTVKYEWRKSLTSEEAALDMEIEPVITDTNTLEVIDAPGWYSVKVVSELNRTPKEKISTDKNGELTACKVTYAPKPPVVASQQATPDTRYATVTHNPATFKVDATIDGIDMWAKELLSDNIHYVWQISYIDLNTFENIPEGLNGIEGLGTPAITVSNKLNAQVAFFRCLVINELNGAKAIFDHSGTYVSDGSMGDFKEEVPYRYEKDSNLNFNFVAINT